MRLPILSLIALAGTALADPQTSSWLTTYATKYARIYTTDANKLAGTSVTTWTNGTQVQSLPAYCGVQEVSYSASWTYIRTSGLGSHIMGPWYLNAAHTTIFPNLPKNQKVLYRFPRTPSVPATKTLTGLGAIGYFVDGVAMFDSRDGFVWTDSAESGTTITALITLPTMPPNPPTDVMPLSVTLAGTISGTNFSRPSQSTVQCTFVIPAGAPTGAQNVVVTFSGPPHYTLTGGLTITP